MEMKKTIESLIKTAIFNVWKMGISQGAPGRIVIEHPEDFSHGDYSTSAALSLARFINEPPRELAQKLVLEMLKDKPKEILRIEVAGPGFINFHLSSKFFADAAKQIIKDGEKFGRNDFLKKQKFLVEHTQPNPFKEFHIGHLMNNAIGESLSRIIRENGAEVRDVSYHGDVGLHVAKTIWWLLVNKTNPADFKTLGEKIKHLAKAYAEGDRAYADDEGAKKEIETVNKKIYERSDKEVNKLYDWGRKASLDYFESIYEELESRFEHHFYESETGEIGKKLVEKNIPAIFEKSEGAVVFKGEKYGLHTRVFLNKDNLPTYEAKELGLAELKRKFYKYDTSLTITANEQDSFFKVVEAAIAEVFPELRGKLKHIGHGLLKLPTGKMSSRTGSVISAESLIAQVKEKVFEKIAERDLSNFEREDIAEMVALGAIKYSILHQSAGSDIIFDFDK
jgi:arginyl-tRNA synthetase